MDEEEDWLRSQQGSMDVESPVSREARLILMSQTRGLLSPSRYAYQDAYNQLTLKDLANLYLKVGFLWEVYSGRILNFKMFQKK
jgi:hypothetical protein